MYKLKIRPVFSLLKNLACIQVINKIIVFLVMSGIILVLTNEQTQIRRAGVDLVSELYSVAKDDGSMFSSLQKKIVRCREEIESDPMYINQVWYA